MRMMHSEMVVHALTEFHQECKANATVYGSHTARIMLPQIERTKQIVESQIAFAESMLYPDFVMVANIDGDEAVIEMAILEFAWTVQKNFSEGQNFRTACNAMVQEFDEMEWRTR